MADVPLLFAVVSQEYMNMRRPSSEQSSHQISIMSQIYDQLCRLGYLNDVSPSHSPASIAPHDVPDTNPELNFNFIPVDTIVTNFLDFTPELLSFVQCNMRQQITSAASSLHDAHARCLQMLILYAHDLARDVLVTPKRIKYARTKEEELYTQLIDLASKKQGEIKELVHTAIAEAAEDVVSQVVQLEFDDSSLDSSYQAPDQKTAKKCVIQIQELVFKELSRQISDKLISSVDYLRESVVGTLRRCLEKLEDSVSGDVSQDTSQALSQILDTAYNLEFNERTSTSAVRLFVERIKSAFQGPSLKHTKMDSGWREKYVRQMIASLSATRLAKSICAQFRAKVTVSHETFLAAIKQLEMRHSGRLKETEGQRDTIRKVLTPKMARLSLSSIALRDVIIHGIPVTSRELGRGQYGVVFQCAEWAGQGPLAVKSVVPPDEKHWNDLALEFHYTWTLPKNDRVVNLVGALIDDDYTSGSNAVVLFIMPRYPRDLHAALKVGLDFGSRMQIGLDAVEGIRFLHGQGLLHRDIKLKNVLLNNANRGTLTDLGFCKPEAMMTCTIVGTPIHMAPELFGGSYDNSVDIYAFGILFWYICANDTKLPGAFDACQNKEQLWTSVRKGLRPERLPRFDTDCWELMCSCWLGESIQRPLIGDVALRLHLIMKRIGRTPLK
ncbi:Dual serine/threonine and tyrosine protein kinase [Geodia barretti]|nr:Dual serine/threonine and tyrosine protein kinase [Geodia barretti]